MSHFYAMIPVSARKTIATARGHVHTGIETVAASWSGAIRVTLEHRDGKDIYTVTEEPWQGSGISRHLARGVLGE